MSKPTLARPIPPLSASSWPIVPPLMPSVAYAVDTPDALDAVYDQGTDPTYAREGHPNATMLAAEIARLEGVAAGLVTGSGMAAISAVLLGLVGQGDHVIGGARLYGRSLRLLQEVLPRYGADISLVDTACADGVRGALRPNTKLVLLETIANPLTDIADLDGIAAVLADHPALLAVDNTFATPLGCQPMRHGADLVIHSVTKLLGGHSDVTLGWVGGAAEVIAQLDAQAVTLGLTASPRECWQASKALGSFALRFERATTNAALLADHLADLPGVRQVFYPGRPDHPQAERAASQLQSAGNMLAFDIGGGREDANRLAQAATEAGIAFAPTLGDIGTTLSHPASSSHRGVSPAARASLGITETSFRVSVGIEDVLALKRAFSYAVNTAMS